ncbi:putative ABC transporter permease [Enterococcus timonensis]|uniref:putative ABC transporter permease n=1 Tax=Enterococcus timonensis TaxID=1852364 RepID=UPI0008DAB6DD|nr:putative ABC transporter permease [Enterococcus timonensis]
MFEMLVIILLFFMYSFLGWSWETVYVSLRQKHFAYRGFLFGPITPIYGFAILGVLYFLEPLQNNVGLLFVGAVVICSVAEYVTSFALEKMFHASWWDYHDVPLNVNGRIALPISLFWGLACLGIVYYVQPLFLQGAQFVLRKTGPWLPLTLTAITIADLIMTVKNMVAFQKAVAAINASLAEKVQEVTSNLEEVKTSIAEKRDNAESLLNKRRQKLAQWREDLFTQPEKLLKVPQFNFHQRRWLKNFQRLELKNSALSSEEIRKFIKERQAKFTDKKR